MTYRQYTKCVERENFTHLIDGMWNGILQAVFIGLQVTLGIGAAALIAVLAIKVDVNPVCFVFLIWVFIMAGAVGYCYWWLYMRLICIPAPPDHPADSAGDHLAVGLLINVEPPGSGGFLDNIDNDYSIGILPCPLPLGATRSDIVAPPPNGSPYGYLVAEQPVTSGLPYAGESAIDTKKTCVDKICSEVLHCEFEGRGMYDMFLAAQAGLFLAIAALFVCLFVPGLIGWIIAAILAFLSLAGIVIGWAVGKYDSADRGDPSDVNPNLRELQLNDCNHKGADTLLIKGHWVYDSLHTGANELHPVTFACLTNCDNVDPKVFRDRWQAALDDATSPTTIENQKQPQNQWQVHPLIDGCQAPIIV